MIQVRSLQSAVRELENSVLMNTILSVYAWQSHFFTVAFSHIFTASFFFSLLVFLIQQSIYISQMINGQCNFVTAVSHGRISIWCGCEMKYDPYLCLLVHCKIIFPSFFFYFSLRTKMSRIFLRSFKVTYPRIT